MRIFCLLICLLLVVGCQTVPKNPEEWMVRYKNSCVPTAIAFRQSLVRQGIWARVFDYQYSHNGKEQQHAMTAFLYPPGENKLWAYDALGSSRIRAYLNDVESIAVYAHFVRGADSSTVKNAEWID